MIPFRPCSIPICCSSAMQRFDSKLPVLSVRFKLRHGEAENTNSHVVLRVAYAVLEWTPWYPQTDAVHSDLDGGGS